MTLEEIERYGRQLILDGWGAAGQERLAAARATVRGGGPAARAAALYLAGAGVGRLGLERFADEARALNGLIAVEELAPDGAPGAALVEAAGARFTANDDRAAAGAWCATEALKALLGFPTSGSEPRAAGSGLGLPHGGGMP
jgi:hypothetical protein